MNEKGREGGFARRPMYIILIIVVAIVGWEVVWRMLGVGLIFPWQLKSELNRLRGEGVLADVRTPEEYRFFRIDGAKEMPDLLVRNDIPPPDDPDQPVVVICMSGHRSPVAAYRLKRSGYRNVRHLVWGMAGWKLVGGETVSGETPHQE